MVVGLVGCGRWGRHILRDLVALGCEVPVVARSPASIARAADGGASVIAPDVARLPAVDAAVVATTTSAHAEVVGEVLALGVPVFCEKPLTNDPEAAAVLAAQAPDSLFVMDKWRYHPGIVELGAIAQERRLGEPHGLRTTRIGWGNPHDDVDVVWMLAPHELAICMEIMRAVGQPAAAAAVWRGDAAQQMVALTVGDGWWHAFEVSALSPERRRRVELVCEEGVAVLEDAWDEHVIVAHATRGELDAERIATPGELPLLAELRAFVDHVSGGPRPRSSASEGAAVVSAIAELRALAVCG